MTGLDQRYIAGASSSLNKTITEIMESLGQAGRPIPDDMPLREILHDRLADLGEKWLARGFKRGHRMAYKLFTEEGAVPLVMDYDSHRRLFQTRRRKVILRSKIPARMVPAAPAPRRSGRPNRLSSQ